MKVLWIREIRKIKFELNILFSHNYAEFPLFYFIFYYFEKYFVKFSIILLNELKIIIPRKSHYKKRNFHGLLTKFCNMTKKRNIERNSALYWDRALFKITWIKENGSKMTNFMVLSLESLIFWQWLKCGPAPDD